MTIVVWLLTLLAEVAPPAAPHCVGISALPADTAEPVVIEVCIESSPAAVAETARGEASGTADPLAPSQCSATTDASPNRRLPHPPSG